MAALSKRRVLLVQFGPEHRLSLTVSRALGQWRGTTIHLLSDSPHSAARYSRYVASSAICPDSLTQEQRVEALLQETRRTAADVVLPVDQWATRTVIAARSALPSSVRTAPVPSVESLAVADDKGALAELLAQNGIPLPRTLAVGAGDAFEAAIRGLRFPVLLKPARSAGGRGIESFPDADAIIGRIRGNPTPSGASIVQEFVPGSDLGCNVLCERGQVIAYTLQRGLARRPYPFQICPAVSFGRDDAALESVRRLMAALRWDGVANVDLRKDSISGCASVLEINPRFWASLLASVAFGVNFAELACRLALGLEVPFEPVETGTFIVREASALRDLAGRLDWEGETIRGSAKSVLRFVARDPVPTVMPFVRALIPPVRTVTRRGTPGAPPPPPSTSTCAAMARSTPTSHSCPPP